VCASVSSAALRADAERCGQPDADSRSRQITRDALKTRPVAWENVALCVQVFGGHHWKNVWAGELGLLDEFGQLGACFKKLVKAGKNKF